MIKRIKQKWLEKRLKEKEFSHLLKEYNGNEFVALDTETTGLNPKRDEILSIGAVIIKENRILVNRAFEAFLKPSGKISEESIKIHHIRPCDLESAKSARDVILSLLDFIGNRPIVGYYIGFDHAILSRYTKEIIGIKLPNRQIELSQMYYRRYRKHSAYEFVDLHFDTIMKELNLPPLGKHDALNDAIMSAMIYLKLKELPEYKGAYA